MKKKPLLWAGSGVVILLAAIFLPIVCWNAHLKALTRNPEVQTVAVSDNMHITRPDEFADLYVSGKFFQESIYNDFSNSRMTEFEQIKKMISNFFNYLEPDAKAYYFDILNTSNFEYSNIQPIRINTNIGPEYFAMINGQLSYYGGDEIIFININYEQKTQTIFFFSIFSDPAEKDNGFSELKYSSNLANAATKYYSNYGISDKYYSTESDNYSFHFYLKDPSITQKEQDP